MRAVALLLFLVSVLQLPAESGQAPSADTYRMRQSWAFELVQKNSPEADKALQALLKEKPNDTDVLLRLAGVVAAHGRMLDPGRTRRKIMKEAREYYERAAKAGSNDPLIASAFAAINKDGSENTTKVSDNTEIDRKIHQAEEAFGRREFDRAIEHFRAVLVLEPTNYIAHLHLGDTYFATGRYPEAIEWFKKTIVLAPDAETAYRYSGDALLRLRRKDEALDYYLSAVIAEPYNGYPWRALNEGCAAMLIKPWSPARDLPAAQIKSEPKGAQIRLPENFHILHVAYATARAKWLDENRATRFPGNLPYRQTLEEETYGLRTMLTVAAELKAAKPDAPELAKALTRCGPSLEQLVEINSAGLLEAHVLFFRANAEIAADYADYRAKNREKLRSYLLKYYLHLP